MTGLPPYAVATTRELDRVLSQIDGNVDLERDMAAEAVTALIRARLPDFAVMYPRHRFGFRYARQGAMVQVQPPVAGGSPLSDAFRTVPFYVAAKKVRVGLHETRALANHIDDVARTLEVKHYRVVPDIEPLGIEAADPVRARLVLGRARNLLYDEPISNPPPKPKPWIRANEGERREMLKDCGWL